MLKKKTTLIILSWPESSFGFFCYRKTSGEITWAARGNHVGPTGKSRGPPGEINKSYISLISLIFDIFNIKQNDFYHFIFQNWFLAILVTLPFCTNFRIMLFESTKTLAGDFNRDCIKAVYWFRDKLHLYWVFQFTNTIYPSII